MVTTCAFSRARWIPLVVMVSGLPPLPVLMGNRCLFPSWSTVMRWVLALATVTFDAPMPKDRVTSRTPYRPMRPEPSAAFFEHIAEHDRLYGALLGRSGSPWFAARMRAAMAEMVTGHLEPGADALAPTVLGAMFVQAIGGWLDHDRPMTAREIAERTGRLASAVITEAATWTENSQG
jgi:hypothetical protein